MLLGMMCAVALGQTVVPAGTIGVVSVASSGDTSTTLKFTFPSIATGKARVAFAGKLVLFDAKGPLFTFDPPASAKAAFWCQNDGGDHHRPELTMTIPVARLARKLAPTSERDESGLPIAAFVRVDGAKPPALGPSKEKAVLTGDAEGDGTPDAIVAVRKADAGCGPKLEGDRLVLVTKQGDADLRCCGP